MGFVLFIVNRMALLKDFDPDWRPEGAPAYPCGKADFTLDPDQAMVFESKEAAYKCWQAQSMSCPLRPDGKPNKPLTAYTVLIQELPLSK